MPSVADLVVYPLKSGAPVRVAEARVTRIGLEGDRVLMVVDERGDFVTQREQPSLALVLASVTGETVRLRLPSGEEASARVGPDAPTRAARVWSSDVRALSCGAALDALLSRYLGAPVSLVRLDPSFDRAVSERWGAPGDVVSFADGYPLLVVTTASLDDLNARLEAPIPIGRFRPNVVVSGADAFEEDAWTTLQIGEARFDVVKPCARCAMIDVDPATGTRESGVLKALAAYRRADLGVIFGQNLIPRTLGRIRVGDPVVARRAAPR